jgi:hypothetical protein
MMSHSTSTEHQKVSIEALLHLKRAERPPPEFWNRFEQELRAKQLAAIIEKKPWWLIAFRLPKPLRSLSRYQTPLAGAALLALCVLGVREYHQMPVISHEQVARPVGVTSLGIADMSGGEIAVHAPLDPALSRDPVAHHVALPVSMDVVAAEGAHIGTPLESHPTVSTSGPVAVGSGGLLAMIPWAAPDSRADRSHPSVILGELPPMHFASAVFFNRSDLNFESSVEVGSLVMPVSKAPAKVAETEVPVAAPLSPREVRRNRILTSLVVADNSSEIDRSRLGQVREVLASALDDDGLYDSVRRLGMGGDRLTLKF